MFKRFFCTLLIIAMAANIFSTCVIAADNDDVKVVLDGTELVFDVKPQIIDGRTMVPMRKIFESMGAQVRWEPDEQAIYAQKDDINIVMKLGSNEILINDTAVVLDVPPMLVDSRTLVPVRAVAESFKAKVGWHQDSQTVTITSADPADTPKTPEPSGNANSDDIYSGKDFACIVAPSIDYTLNDKWYGTIDTDFLPVVNAAQKAYIGQSIMIEPFYVNFKIDSSHYSHVVSSLSLKKPNNKIDVIYENADSINGRWAEDQIAKSLEYIEYVFDENDLVGKNTFILTSTDLLSGITVERTMEIDVSEYKYKKDEFKSLDEFLKYILTYSYVGDPDRIIDAVIYAEKNELIFYPVILSALVEITAKNSYIMDSMKKELKKTFGKNTQSIDIFLNASDNYIKNIEKLDPPSRSNISLPDKINDIMDYGACEGIFFVTGSYIAAKMIAESAKTQAFSKEMIAEYGAYSIEEMIEGSPLFAAYCKFMIKHEPSVSESTKNYLADLLGQ